MELRRLSQPGAAADQAQIRDKLNTLAELETTSASEIRAAQAAIDEILEAWQQARFRVFEEMMEQRKIELLMRARQRR
jgi:hypothetical protein